MGKVHSFGENRPFRESNAAARHPPSPEVAAEVLAGQAEIVWATGGGERRSTGSVAERVGFEPTVRFCRTHAFQACALSHSAISPVRTSCRSARLFSRERREG